MSKWIQIFAAQWKLDPGEKNNIETYESKKLFSIYYELQTIITVGVLLLATSVGIFLYKNIDTIGHSILVLLTGIAAVMCFVFCMVKKEKQATITYYDNVLYLGCLLLVSCVGYWQYQYGIFGNHHAFAILIPAIVITAFSYYFNDRAILSLAITLWAGYLGFTISVPAILYGQNFRSLQLIFTAIIFACVLMALAYTHYHYKRNLPFGFTIASFAFHIMCLALLAGIFNQPYSWVWAATLVVICFAAVLFSLIEQSYATFVSAVLYTYIAVSYLCINFLMHHHILESTYFLLIYFIATSIMLIKYIREGKQKLFKA
jgi:hypothetical protein